VRQWQRDDKRFREELQQQALFRILTGFPINRRNAAEPCETKVLKNPDNARQSYLLIATDIETCSSERHECRYSAGALGEILNEYESYLNVMWGGNLFDISYALGGYDAPSVVYDGHGYEYVLVI